MSHLRAFDAAGDVSMCRLSEVTVLLLTLHAGDIATASMVSSVPASISWHSNRCEVLARSFLEGEARIKRLITCGTQLMGTVESTFSGVVLGDAGGGVTPLRVDSGGQSSTTSEVAPTARGNGVLTPAQKRVQRHKVHRGSVGVMQAYGDALYSLGPYHSGLVAWRVIKGK